ncbi:MAG: hypothetical protein JW928_08075 [Candidatus Aureabacteria bacterium]|nr:hypothetical protein [Candidatus Auribacterota bacterium]
MTSAGLKKEISDSQEVFKQAEVLRQKKIIMETPVKNFHYYRQIRGSELISGRQYAGCIISLFYEGELVFQKTDNRNLRGKGINNL